MSPRSYDNQLIQLDVLTANYQAVKREYEQNRILREDHAEELTRVIRVTQTLPSTRTLTSDQVEQINSAKLDLLRRIASTFGPALPTSPFYLHKLKETR